MPTTSNFGWTTPADTDLVKDGAAAIRTLGNGIDTSFLDLKGGTTDQVLAKNSNTDLDFKWVAQDDSNAIQNAIVDAKGDLISATAADTPARLAVGANDTVLTADSSTATGLKWSAPVAESLTLLNSGGTTLTGASVTISSIPQTYKNLYILVVNFKSDPVDNRSLHMRFNNDAGANRHNAQIGEVDVNNGAFNETFSVIGSSADATDAQGILAGTLYDYTNTTTWKVYKGLSVTNNGTTSTNYNYGIRTAIYNQTSAITSLTFLTTATYNLNGGTLYLYGVK